MRKGDKKLRGADEKIPLSEEELQEYIRCREDIIYFAEKYFTIVDAQKGHKGLIVLREYQKRILKAFVSNPDNLRNTALLSSRQIGKCVSLDTLITIRNKKTGKIDEISIGDLFELIETRYILNNPSNNQQDL